MLKSEANFCGLYTPFYGIFLHENNIGCDPSVERLHRGSSIKVNKVCLNADVIELIPCIILFFLFIRTMTGVFSVLRIRKGNWDNLRIFSEFRHNKSIYAVTPPLYNRLVETILRRGNNIYFLLKIRKKNL